MNPTPPPTVLVVDPDVESRASLVRELEGGGIPTRIAANGEEALGLLATWSVEVVLLELGLAQSPALEWLGRIRQEEDAPEVVVLVAPGRLTTAMEAMQLGAYDYLSHPVHPRELLLVVRRAWERRSLRLENLRLREQRQRDATPPAVVTRDPQLRQVLEEAARSAQTDGGILISGEPGSGRGLLVRLIHALSPRGSGPLVTLDLSGSPGHLHEVKLFGQDPSSLSGGGERRRLGGLEMADRGTLELREPESMYPRSQAHLLDVLETGAYHRLGGARQLPLNLRIIAVTRRSGAELQESGELLPGLLRRLATTALAIPPLRARRGDIPLLAGHFIRTLPGGGADRTLSPEAVAILSRHPWPGNVRELKAVMGRALLLAPQGKITPEAIPLTGPPPMDESASASGILSLEDLERRHIKAVLDHTGWHRARAAEVLGVSPSTLYRKIRRYGLSAAS